MIHQLIFVSAPEFRYVEKTETFEARCELARGREFPPFEVKAQAPTLSGARTALDLEIERTVASWPLPRI